MSFLLFSFSQVGDTSSENEDLECVTEVAGRRLCVSVAGCGGSLSAVV